MIPVGSGSPGDLPEKWASTFPEGPGPRSRPESANTGFQFGPYILDRLLPFGLLLKKLWVVMGISVCGN